jgi:hypothetical protein
MIKQELEQMTKFFSNEDKYREVSHGALVGLYISIYCKQKLFGDIKDLRVSINKLGVKETMGNKGGCSIRFVLKDSSLTFACCHLESGRSTELEQARRSQIEKII